jgi:predicted DNA-binding transcriptional regulator YafY
MRRADRLLQIVQILRRRSAPTTAMFLAEELEVVPRTIYRDIAVLQASRVPVDGEAGVGYVLRPGYDLPPMMFNAPELEAVVLGLNMVIERGDPELVRGASDVLAKIHAVVPRDVADQMWKAMLLVPHTLENEVGFGAYVATIRAAIRENCKLHIGYADAKGCLTERIIWPLGLYLFSHATLVCAWCEERQDFRAFRSDRINACETLNARFDSKNGALMKQCLVAFTQRD